MFSGVSDPSENRETCAPGRAADWGSMTLTLRSAADAAEKETRSKNQAQSARITILLFTRKGLRWTVYAGLLALRVRMVEQLSAVRHADDRWSYPTSENSLQTAFPGNLPVTGCDFLAYSCAAARELHPLPCLRHMAKTRKPKGHFKELEILVSGIYRAGVGEVNRRSGSVGVSFRTVGKIPSTSWFWHGECYRDLTTVAV